MREKEQNKERFSRIETTISPKRDDETFFTQWLEKFKRDYPDLADKVNGQLVLDLRRKFWAEIRRENSYNEWFDSIKRKYNNRLSDKIIEQEINREEERRVQQEVLKRAVPDRR